MNSMKEAKTQRLKTIDIYRTFAVYSVVFYHTNQYFPVSSVFEYCSIGVYACLVLTGFLYGFSHSDDLEVWHFHDSCRQAAKKIVKFFPLHFFTFLLVLILQLITDDKFDLFSKYEISKALTNLTLLQSFIPREDFYFSYNGVSWYLSTTLFLYFMAPLIACALKRIEKKCPLHILLIPCVLIEMMIILLFSKSKYATWIFYINPLNNLYGLTLGMIWGKIRVGKQSKEKNKAVDHTLLWIETVILLVMVCSAGREEFMYCYLPFMFVTILYLISSAKGCISRLLSNRLWKFTASFSFEVFMLHQVVGKYMNALKYTYGIAVPDALLFMAMILISMILAYGWHISEKALRGYLSKKRLARQSLKQT